MRRDALRRAGVLLAAGVLLLAVVMLVGLLLTHVLVHGRVGHLDDAIERSLARSRTGLGNSLTFAGTQLAEPLNVEVALAVLVLPLAAVTRAVRPALFLAVTVIGESANTSSPAPRCPGTAPSYRASGWAIRSRASPRATPLRRCACTALWPSSPGASRLPGPCKLG